MQTISTIGLDIAKLVFQVHGVDAAGQVVLRRQLRRRQVLAFFSEVAALPASPNLPPIDCVAGSRLPRSEAHTGGVPVALEQRKLAAIVAADVGYSPDLASHAVGPLAKANRQFLFGEAER